MYVYAAINEHFFTQFENGSDTIMNFYIYKLYFLNVIYVFSFNFQLAQTLSTN